MASDHPAPREPRYRRSGGGVYRRDLEDPSDPTNHVADVQLDRDALLVDVANMLDEALVLLRALPQRPAPRVQGLTPPASRREPGR